MLTLSANLYCPTDFYRSNRSICIVEYRKNKLPLNLTHSPRQATGTTLAENLTTGTTLAENLTQDTFPRILALQHSLHSLKK